LPGLFIDAVMRKAADGGKAIVLNLQLSGQSLFLFLPASARLFFSWPVQVHR
jgi:hypothetical protein